VSLNRGDFLVRGKRSKSRMAPYHNLARVLEDRRATNSVLIELFYPAHRENGQMQYTWSEREVAFMQVGDWLNFGSDFEKAEFALEAQR
jgi:hypothetical protein